VSEAQFLTVEQYAAAMNLGIATVYRALKRGEIEHVKVGHSIRIPRTAIEVRAK